MGGALPAADVMDVTNRFVLDFARKHGGRILDYGCGAGQVVVEGRDSGLDIYGTDVYYGGSTTRAEAEATGLFGDRLRDMTDGRIPFPDAFFNLVTSNQVMEHVDDLDRTLSEIARVLVPGGTALSLFPSADVWREGHIGIPFAHWFSKGSHARFLYTWALRKAGLGTWKEQAPNARQWAVDKLGWIDQWTRYRCRHEIFAAYNNYFTNELREIDYIRYRLLDRPSAIRAILAKHPPPFAAELFRKLGFLVILSRKAT
jgi:SAM-dependent methyltransferase